MVGAKAPAQRRDKAPPPPPPPHIALLPRIAPRWSPAHTGSHASAAKLKLRAANMSTYVACPAAPLLPASALAAPPLSEVLTVLAAGPKTSSRCPSASPPTSRCRPLSGSTSTPSMTSTPTCSARTSRSSTPCAATPSTCASPTPAASRSCRPTPPSSSGSAASFP